MDLHWSRIARYIGGIGLNLDKETKIPLKNTRSNDYVLAKLQHCRKQLQEREIAATLSSDGALTKLSRLVPSCRTRIEGELGGGSPGHEDSPRKGEFINIVRSRNNPVLFT